MRTEDDLNHLIVRIYQHGLDAASWPQMLDAIAAFYGCSKSAYMHVARNDAQRDLHYFRHPEPDAPRVLNGLQTYLEMPPGSDVWYEMLQRPEMKRDGAILCNNHLPFDELLASDCYNLVVNEFGGFDNLGMRVAENDEYGCFLSVYSDGPERIFTEEDFALHRELYPHIRRVVDTQTRFGHAMRAAAISSAALDFLDFGIAIVNARGKIAFANEAALALMLAPGGVRERGGCLVAANGENAALQSALGAACGVSVAPVGETLHFPRAPGAAPLVLEVLPFDPTLDEDPFQRFGFERLAFVVFCEPDKKPLASRDLLIMYFGLRPSEARVAELLIAGLSQKEIAETLQIGEGTVRWHVKNMLSKLEVRRESQMIIKLQAALAPIRSREQTRPSAKT